ncbi:epoxide hydrolase family protein [Nocardia sp. CA-128927]|uniref:epoxide hydrolase family protein n=1 Tax=Nocardia sp. CA-128927 TaxID=3239975 RepID=UPI003D9876DB
MRFAIDVAQSVLDDLDDRLRRTRLPAAAPGQPWSAGTDPAYLGELIEYWRNDFDWRAAERRLNAHPQFLIDIAGTPIHFVHVRGDGDDRVPLILTHGWPSTFAEMLPLVPLLADGFDLVIPDLPGFGYSGPLTGPTTEAAIADLWAALMSQLGYHRFGAGGGDIGSGVSTWLGARYPDRVIGIHTHHIKFPPASRRVGLSTAEQAFVAQLATKGADDYGYGIIQATRPDTLAAGLTDSPSGLAAWIIEKFQRWSDCAGEIERRFSKDDLLTTVMLYWVTGSIGTSFRPYRDDDLGPELPMVDVPVGVTMSVEDAGLPREFAERVYSDIRHWREPTVGGHFFAQEEPELLAADLRLFFQLCRE